MFVRLFMVGCCAHALVDLAWSWRRTTPRPHLQRSHHWGTDNVVHLSFLRYCQVVINILDISLFGLRTEVQLRHKLILRWIQHREKNMLWWEQEGVQASSTPPSHQISRVRPNWLLSAMSTRRGWTMPTLRFKHWVILRFQRTKRMISTG